MPPLPALPAGKDASGVVGVLDEALRRAGGGVALVVDPSGQVWAHSLPQGDYAPQGERRQRRQPADQMPFARAVGEAPCLLPAGPAGKPADVSAAAAVQERC